jgi:hypothetical protein
VITGTPVGVDIDGNAVTVIYTTEDRSATFVINCATQEAADFCYALWLDLVVHAEMLHDDEEVIAYISRTEDAEDTEEATT